MEVTDLRMAAEWTCDACGIINFCSVVVDESITDSVLWVPPKNVTCCSCNKTFKANSDAPFE